MSRSRVHTLHFVSPFLCREFPETKCVRRLFTVFLVTVDRLSAFPYRCRYQDFSRRTSVSVPFLVFNACCLLVKSSISLSTMGTQPIVAVGLVSELFPCYKHKPRSPCCRLRSTSCGVCFSSKRKAEISKHGRSSSPSRHSDILSPGYQNIPNKSQCFKIEMN